MISDNDYQKYLEDLAEAAVAAVTTDDGDKWNELVDVYDQTPQEVIDRLARR